MTETNLSIDASIEDVNMADAPEHEPKAASKINKIYLKDYLPPAYAVHKVDMTIQMFDDHALVASTLAMSRLSDASAELALLGQELELLEITMNGQPLAKDEYELTADKLTINNAPSEVTLKTLVKISPQTNTALEGLYIAGEGDDAMYVTQCEPEGFRKITFFPDRPDVLAEFTTRLEADKKYPTLLANGNLLEAGELEANSNRHYAIWHDPTKKPSYLFACVFADLNTLQDTFTTSEGREVLLEVYAKAHDIEKCHLAMQALKDSMLWDEQNYGRAYDLDRYMIVAVSQFNMGAMENKGLNIFNTACVLSSPQTTTDTRSFSVKAIIAHEYFHNWTGNRITCRDWFQLCLKEGFTVFRDQSFSADQQSAAVQRIDDVALLRAHQFAEDAGSLAHPVRPESFVEINNFYTTTVYEKGAEIVRMIANMMGKDKFRQGTDEYFARYDGQAVTIEDFLSALQSVDERVADFIKWYRQPGTPMVTAQTQFKQANKSLTIELSQATRQVAGYDEPIALPIPVACAVFNGNTGEVVAEKMLMLTKDSQVFSFELNGKLDDGVSPVVSLLRDFSAPVTLKFEQTADDLAFLLEHETNGFNRWQANQMLVNQVLQDSKDPSVYLTAVSKAVLSLVNTDPMLAAKLLEIPSERELATVIELDYQPEQVKQKRDNLKAALANELKDDLVAVYSQITQHTDYKDTANAIGERALANQVLDLIALAKLDESEAMAEKQYTNASCMTQRLGALQVMVNYEHAKAGTYLQDFYNQFKAEPLVIDLWFATQAGAEVTSLDAIEKLMTHPDFDWGTPNRIRAVVSNLAARPVALWSAQGIDLLCKVVAKLDSSNPVLAARILQALGRWYTLADKQKTVAQTKLKTLQTNVSSKNVLETLDSILA